jgi:hypothetical protein
MPILNPLKKLQNSCATSYQRKSDKKWSFFYFYYCSKSFRPITSLGRAFLHFFFNGFEHSIKFCV